MIKATFFCVLSLIINNVLINVAVAEKNLNRLFFTPAERAIIDASRQPVKQVSPTKIKVLERTEKITVKGYLKRKGQPDVVWVNSKNTLKSNKPLSDVKVLKVYKNGKVKLKVREKGVVKLKAGQVISRSQQSIREAYENNK